SIQVEYWTSPAIDNMPRPGSYEQPESREGDGPIETVEVPIPPAGTPTIELTLPQLPDDSTTVYWFRAVVKDGRDRTYWSPASGNVRPIPLDRRDVTLSYQSTPGRGKKFQITNDGAFTIKVGTRDQSFSMRVRVETLPTWLPTDPDGDTRGTLRYS